MDSARHTRLVRLASPHLPSLLFQQRQISRASCVLAWKPDLPFFPPLPAGLAPPPLSTEPPVSCRTCFQTLNCDNSREAVVHRCLMASVCLRFSELRSVSTCDSVVG